MTHIQRSLVLSLTMFCALARADSLSIVTYGATPDDATDDNAAIVAAISAARAQGKDVYVPAGRFNHRKFTINGVTVRGSGDASILHAPNSKDAQITLSGSNSCIRDLKSTVTTQNRDPLWCDNIRAEQADNYLIQNVTVEGADGAGIMSYISRNGRIIGNRVSRSLADGIHNTGASYNIIVANNTVRDVGDDMVAVVSYGSGTNAMVYNVLIQDNDLARQTHGRGIAVIGGRDVTIRRNSVTRSSAAGILIGTEGAYSSGYVENVLLEDNTVVEPVYVQTSTGHSGVLVSADNEPVSRVLFRNTTITGASGQGVRLEGAAVPSNIGFINTAINSCGGSAFVISSGTNIYCTGTTRDGVPISPCSGALNFTVTGSSLSYVHTDVQAVIQASPSSGLGPLLVSFDASQSLGSGLTFEWSFGDGQTATGASVSHTYTTFGSFTVRLIARNSSRSDTVTATIRVFDPADAPLKLLGTPIVSITTPTGGGSRDLQIIRDGTYPRGGDYNVAYDTYDGQIHAEDYFGYTFTTSYAFTRLVHYYGPRDPDPAGGVFQSIRVQVRNGGVWSDVSGAITVPAYDPAASASFDSVVVNFPAATGDAIRIIGAPRGGLWVGCAELDVYGSTVNVVIDRAQRVSSAGARRQSPVTIVDLAGRVVREQQSRSAAGMMLVRFRTVQGGLAVPVLRTK